MFRNLYAVLGMILCLNLVVSPQEAPDSAFIPFSAQIKLIGKSYGDSIVLRWAPTTPGAWSYLNKTGYVLERASFQEGGTFEMDGFKVLTIPPLKPLPLEDWEAVVKLGPDTELSSIAAQALYGESFSGSSATLFEAADEFMNRFSFSLLSADLSALTAEALGLRYTDLAVEAGSHYIYRIFPAVPGQSYQIDTAYLVLQNQPAGPLPAPIIEQAYEGELNIKISWDKSLHEPVFTAYYLERSDNGNSFERLTRVPFINPSSDNVNSRSTVFQYVDSIPENYKPYYYRLVGITPFAETSPPSAVTKAMGRDRTPPPSPVNIEARQLGGGAVKITWEMPENVVDLDGFYIGRGDDLDKHFQPIHEEKISRDSTSFIDHRANELRGNYYVVAAIDTAGNGSISMISYAAVIDSIPPLPPTGFSGEIDTTGVVTLQWHLGVEADLAGYMVYFSNSPDHVFSTVNRSPHADTVYTDTIQIRTLTRKVYYRLKAVDTRWNYSVYSDILELTRPDLIPPTSPVFSDYKNSEEGMWLEWIPSSSNDVSGYELVIRENDTLRRRVFIDRQAGAERYHYTHRDLHVGSWYAYTVTTVDSSGLRSAPSLPVRIRGIDLGPKSGIEDLTVTLEDDGRSLNLNWSFPEPEKIKRFIIYRSVEGTSLVTYKSLPPGENSFKDSMLRRGTRYDYSVKAVYHSGRQSPFSNIVTAGIE